MSTESREDLNYMNCQWRPRAVDPFETRRTESVTQARHEVEEGSCRRSSEQAKHRDHTRPGRGIDMRGACPEASSW